MSSACLKAFAAGALVLLVCACEREKRQLEKPHIAPNAVAQANGVADL